MNWYKKSQIGPNESLIRQEISARENSLLELIDSSNPEARQEHENRIKKLQQELKMYVNPEAGLFS